MSASSNERPVTRLFRLWSRFYDNPVPQRLFYRRVHARILRRYRPRSGERVLDVGCGTGLFLEQLAREYQGLELVGVDLSREMLDHARQNTRGASFVEASVYELPFDDASFDVALNTISCHFYLEQTRAFREIARVLRPGGRFLCAAISLRPLLFSAELAGMAVYHPPKVIEQHLRAAGLDVTAHDRVFPGVVLFDCTKR